MAAVLAAMSMVSVESTVVATAMPQIVADLGGLQLYSWVFASFLLSQTAATVVFGKLADIYGVRPTMIAGIAVFLGGSVLCGFAWSMPALIGLRLVQGVGAGAVQPIALTIVADLFPGRQRGRVQGYLASVWAISAVSGPVIGAVIVRDYSWSWIFWMNVPLGLLSALGFYVFLTQKPKSQDKPIDIVGAAIFVALIGSLMIGLTAFAAHDVNEFAAMAAIFASSILLMIRQERLAPDPLLSFELWTLRSIAATNAIAVVANMALMGLTSFVPLYVQGVLKRTPVVAGFALTMIMVGWPLAATIAARVFDRVGLRRLLIFGSSLLPAGSAFFILLTPQSSPVLAGLGSLVMGFGMGLISVSSLLIIQEVADRSQRGSATASNMFSRNLGSALGASFLGAVLNFSLGRHDDGKRVRLSDLERALETTRYGPDHLDPALKSMLDHALHQTFLAMFLLSAVVTILAMLMPEIKIRGSGEAPG